jgi:hypothetical protein
LAQWSPNIDQDVVLASDTPMGDSAVSFWH